MSFLDRNLKAGRQLEGPLSRVFAGDFTREEEILQPAEGVDAVGILVPLNDLGPWSSFI